MEGSGTSSQTSPGFKAHRVGGGSASTEERTLPPPGPVCSQLAGLKIPGQTRLLLSFGAHEGGFGFWVWAGMMGVINTSPREDV